jgi:hypothetical protein
VNAFRWLVAVAALSSPVHAENETASGTPKRAPGPEERAQTWFDEGQAAYASGDYEIAAHLFRAVYEATQAPAVLYDVAQAERLAGRCAQALADYEEYVRVAAGEAPNDVAEKIAEMRQCIAREAKPPAATPAGHAKAGASSASSRDTGGEERAALRATAYGSIAGSAVCAVLGAIYLVHANTASAHLDELDHPGAKWEERYVSYQSSMDRSNQAALGFFIASGVMAAAATTILVFKWPADTSVPKASVSVSLPLHGAGLSFDLRF